MEIEKVNSSVAGVDSKQGQGIWSVNNKGVLVGGEQKITFEQLLKDASISKSDASGVKETLPAKTEPIKSEPIQITDEVKETPQVAKSETPVIEEITLPNDRRGIWSVNNRGVFIGGEQKLTFEKLNQEPIETSQAQVSHVIKTPTSQVAKETTKPQLSTEVKAVTPDTISERVSTSQESAGIWSVNNKGVFVAGEQKITYDKIAGQGSPEASPVAANTDEVGVVKQKAMPVVTQLEKPLGSTEVKPVTTQSTNANGIWSVNNKGVFVSGEQKLTFEQLQALKTAESLSTQENISGKGGASATVNFSTIPGKDVIYSKTYEQHIKPEEKNIFQKIMDFFNFK